MFCFIYRYSSSNKQLSSDDFILNKLIYNLFGLIWKFPLSIFDNLVYKSLGLNWKSPDFTLFHKFLIETMLKSPIFIKIFVDF